VVLSHSITKSEIKMHVVLELEIVSAVVDV